MGNLNLQFCLLCETKPIADAYLETVKTNPYSLLAKSTYDKNPVPLRSVKEYDPEIFPNLEEQKSSPVLTAGAVKEVEDDDNLEDDDTLEDDEVGQDPETDDEFRDHFVQFPNHADFLIKFRNAKIAATTNQKRTYVCWRGHKTSVSPKDPAMAFPKFKGHIISALTNIKDISEKESQVNFIFILFILISLFLYFFFFSLFSFFREKRMPNHR